MENNYILYACGCRGSWPVSGPEFDEFGGSTTCFIVKTGTHALVIDCGTGLYNAGPILADCTKIDVALTHLHYDHVLGLLDFGVFPRTAELIFHSTFKRWFGEKTFDEFFRSPFWPVVPAWGKLSEVEQINVPIDLGDGLSVAFYGAPHPDYGNILVIRAGKEKITLMADYEHNGFFEREAVEGCSLLVYDGMYCDEEYEKHMGWGHSTWQEGCRLAEILRPRQILITHHDPHRTDSQLRRMEQQAKEEFRNVPVHFSRSGEKLDLDGIGVL